MGGPRLLLLLEGGARLLRRAGLGRVVDAVGGRVVASFGEFRAEVDGLVLHGRGAAQMHYVHDLVDGGRERAFVEHLVHGLRPGATVVEGGAHLGYVTLQAARAVGPGGRVLAFEPDPRSLPQLERNLAANGLAGRVTVVPSALGASSGRADLFLGDGGDTSSLFARPDGAVEAEVDVAAADDVLGPDVKADVVKLDVEGGELEALRGMRRLLERSRPGPVLFVECNPPLLASAGATVAELVGWIENAGFDVRWIDERDGSLRPMSEGSWPGGYVNLLCRRTDRA